MAKTRLTLTWGQRHEEVDGAIRQALGRLKTVELIEEETPWIAIHLVKIAYEETALRESIKVADERWNLEQKGWLTTGDVVRRLGLYDRVVGWLEAE